MTQESPYIRGKLVGTLQFVDYAKRPANLATCKARVTKRARKVLALYHGGADNWRRVYEDLTAIYTPAIKYELPLMSSRSNRQFILEMIVTRDTTMTNDQKQITYSLQMACIYEWKGNTAEWQAKVKAADARAKVRVSI